MLRLRQFSQLSSRTSSAAQHSGSLQRLPQSIVLVAHRRSFHDDAGGEHWELLSQKNNEQVSERQHQCHLYEFRHKKLGTRFVHMRPIVSREDSGSREVAHTEHHFHFGLALRTPVLDDRPLSVMTQHCILEGCPTERRHRGASRDVFQQIQRRNTLNSFAHDAENSVSVSDTNASFQFKTSSRKDMLNIVDVATDAVLGARISPEDYYRNLLMPRLSHNNGEVAAFMDDTAAHLITLQSSTSTALRAETTKNLFTGTSVANGGPLGTTEGLFRTRYDDLLQYYQRFYHPSNALLFTYGAMEPQTLLRHLDQTALGSLDKRLSSSTNAHMGMYDEIGDMINRRVERWTEPRKVHSSAPEHDGFLADNMDSMVSFAFLTEADWQQDPLRSYALSVLYSTLRDPFGPLIQQIDKKQENLATMMDEIFTSRINLPDDYLAIGFKAIHQDSIPKLETLFQESLEMIATNGYPERYVQQVLNRHRAAYRDPMATVSRVFEDTMTQWTRGSAQKTAVDSLVLNSNKIFQDVNSPLHPSKFNRFVKETVRSMLLENPHRLTVVLLPEKVTEASLDEKFETLGREYARSEKDMLAKYMPRVHEQIAELARLKDDPKTPYSELYDTEGILTVNDISATPPPSAFNAQLSVEYSDANGEREVLYNEQSDSDGMVEVSCFIFPKYAFRGTLRSFLPLIAKMMQSVGARAMSNDDLVERMLQYTLNGISINAVPVTKPDGAETYGLVMSGKCLYTNVYKMMDLFSSMVSESELTRDMDDDLQREMIDHMMEVIKSEAWEKQMLVMESPTFYLSQHAASQLNKHIHNTDSFNGFTYTQFLHSVMQRLDTEPDEPRNVFEMIKNFLKSLYSANGGVKVLVTSGSKDKDTIVDAMTDFLSNCFSMQAHIDESESPMKVEEEPFNPKSGLTYIESPVPDPVFILTQAIDTVARRHADGPALLVSAFLLNNYFERTVRRKGGAQITCLHEPSGAFITQSTDDRQPFETIHMIREAMQQWLADEMFTSQELDRAKLNAFQRLRLDDVSGPHGRAAGPLTAGFSEEQEMQFRKALLATRSEDIAHVASTYFKDIMFEGYDTDDMSRLHLQKQIYEKNKENLDKRGIDLDAEMKKQLQQEQDQGAQSAISPSAVSGDVQQQQEEEEGEKKLHGGYERVGCMVMMGPASSALSADIRSRLEQGGWLSYE